MSRYETSDYIRQNSTTCSFKGADSWLILSDIELNIKRKIEAIGTPLRDWDIQINYGIKTGYNPAFIIDGNKREELIREDPKSAEIIRPILRGKDIKRYSYDFADKWILFIPWHFPLHGDPTIKGASEKAENAFKSQFPAVYNHLLKFKKELSNRNKAETGIRYEWYALQRWGANYWEEFSKQKIVYIEIMTDNEDMGYKFPSFSFDSENCYVLNTAYIITGNYSEIRYILYALNSKLGRLLTKFYVTQLQQRQFRMLSQYVNRFPLPKIKIDELQALSPEVHELFAQDSAPIINESQERRFLDFLYKLYSFNSEEVRFIDSESVN